MQNKLNVNERTCRMNVRLDDSNVENFGFYKLCFVATVYE